MAKTTIPTGGLADSAVTSAKITDATIASGDLADDAVTAAKIADAVTLGKVLQTQSSSSNSRTTISSGSFSGCGLSDTITCSSSSSKVLVLVSANFLGDTNDASDTFVTCVFQLTRNHSGISETEIFRTRGMNNRPDNNGIDMLIAQNMAISFLDSPSTTNEITYTLNGKNEPSTSGLEVSAGGASEFTKGITLIEIGA